MTSVDLEADHEIPLPNVKSSVLVKVIEFLKHHGDVEPMFEIEKVSYLFSFIDSSIDHENYLHMEYMYLKSIIKD